MGFVIADSPKEKHCDKYHKLIKKTDKHLIVVTYEVRNRLYNEGKKVEEIASILQVNGISADMLGEEFEEKNMQKKF